MILQKYTDIKLLKIHSTKIPHFTAYIDLTTLQSMFASFIKILLRIQLKNCLFPFHLKFTILAESSILKNLLIHCDRTCHSDVVILTQTLFFYIIINKHWLYWIPASNLLTSSSFSLHCADNSLILASMSRISPSSTSGNWPCNEFNAY